MRIVKFTDVRGKQVCFDADQFLAIRERDGTVEIVSSGGHIIPVHASPEGVLEALGLEGYVEEQSVDLSREEVKEGQEVAV